MRTVYLDELFLLNFAVDYIVLWATARMSAAPFRRLRLLLGAAAGGVYAVAAYFGFARLDCLAAKILAALAILLISFGFVSGKLFLRRVLTFFVFSFLLGGIAYSASLMLGGSIEEGMIAAPWILRAAILVSALAVGIIGSFSRGSAVQREAGSVRVRLTLGGRSAEFDALRDSGNTLRDPLDGAPVLVAELDALAPLFSFDALQILRSATPVEAVEALGASAKWRLLPFRTAAGSSLMAAFRPDTAEIGGRSVHILVAISGGSLGAYPALVGEVFTKTGERRGKGAALQKVS